MSLQNFTIDEAAELLRCKKRFLEDNLQRFPHQKFGKAVVFDENELLAIKDSCRVRQAEATDHGPQTEVPVAALASIRPSQSRRRTG
ncbi:hypothetical protein ACFTTN_14340 [Streptomyces niveus]|uniref:hypothetical protein n=1 Tax=Streptomyces niveus TaxID=193462 RepID=UPI00362FE85D